MFSSDNSTERRIVSPVKSPSQRGNLTGIPRKIKDLCVDWHNQHLKWTELSGQGFHIVQDISNIKLQSWFENEEKESAEKGNVIDIPPELALPLDKLLVVIQGLERIVKKMSAIAASFSGICDLECHQRSASFHNLSQDSSPDPMFMNWSTDRFYTNAVQLLEMHESELTIRRILYENIAHARNRDLLMVHTAIWLHQPCIKETALFLLDSMLQETGLK